MVCASILMCHSLGHAAQQLGERDVWGHVWGYTELQNRENPASMRTSANDGNPPLRQNTKALDFKGFLFLHVRLLSALSVVGTNRLTNRSIDTLSSL